MVCVCGTGYGGVVLELRTGMGNIRALFLDISVNYGLLSTLDDHGPTLVDANRDTSLGPVNVGECWSGWGWWCWGDEGWVVEGVEVVGVGMVSGCWGGGLLLAGVVKY